MESAESETLVNGDTSSPRNKDQPLAAAAAATTVGAAATTATVSATALEATAAAATLRGLVHADGTTVESVMFSTSCSMRRMESRNTCAFRMCAE